MAENGTIACAEEFFNDFIAVAISVISELVGKGPEEDVECDDSEEFTRRRKDGDGAGEDLLLVAGIHIWASPDGLPVEGSLRLKECGRIPFAGMVVIVVGITA